MTLTSEMSVAGNGDQVVRKNDPAVAKGKPRTQIWDYDMLKGEKSIWQ